MFKTKRTDSTEIGVCDSRALKHNVAVLKEHRIITPHRHPSSTHPQGLLPFPSIWRFRILIRSHQDRPFSQPPSSMPRLQMSLPLSPTCITTGPHVPVMWPTSHSRPCPHAGISPHRHPPIIAGHLSPHHWSSKLTRVKFLTYQTIMKQENNTL